MTDTAEVQLPALPTMPAMTQNDLVQLARAVACDLKPMDAILNDFNLTAEQYAVIQQKSFFQGVLDTFIIEWEAAKNTPERIKLQSAITLEDALPKIGARMKSDKEDLNKVVEAGKLFAKLAGVGERDTAGLGGEKISININLGGGDTIRLEKDITPVEAKAEPSPIRTIPQGAGDFSAVPADGEAPGSPAPLRHEPEGAGK